jgi:hypothetical protein
MLDEHLIVPVVPRTPVSPPYRLELNGSLHSEHDSEGDAIEAMADLVDGYLDDGFKLVALNRHFARVYTHGTGLSIVWRSDKLLAVHESLDAIPASMIELRIVDARHV